MGFLNKLFGKQPPKAPPEPQTRPRIPFQSNPIPPVKPGTRESEKNLAHNWGDAARTTDKGQGLTATEITKHLGVSNSAAVNQAIKDADIKPVGSRQKDLGGRHAGGKYDKSVEVGKYDPADVPKVAKQLEKHSTEKKPGTYEYNSPTGKKKPFSLRDKPETK